MNWLLFIQKQNKMKKLVVLIVLIFVAFTAQSQEKKDKKQDLLVKIKEGENPTIYVDGKIFNFPFELLDQSKIASVMVFKGKAAIKKYNAPNGVVVIKTKAAEKSNASFIKNSKKNFDETKKPLVIIDGKVSTEKELNKLNTYNIEKMEIVKGEKAIKKYKAPNGVILITTKKEK